MIWVVFTFFDYDFTFYTFFRYYGGNFANTNIELKKWAFSLLQTGAESPQGKRHKQPRERQQCSRSRSPHGQQGRRSQRPGSGQRTQLGLPQVVGRCRQAGSQAGRQPGRQPGSHSPTVKSIFATDLLVRACKNEPLKNLAGLIFFQSHPMMQIRKTWDWSFWSGSKDNHLNLIGCLLLVPPRMRTRKCCSLFGFRLFVLPLLPRLCRQGQEDWVSPSL